MNLPNHPPEVDQNMAGLVRLSAAARLAKVTPELLEAGIEDGTVPLKIIPLGRRFKYVRAADLGRWLSGKAG